MPDASELHSLIDAAEKAGAAGDWSSAEELLRQAVDGQEAALGQMHPDLANTLNNLGVVCEKTGKIDEAEQYYRRAYAIAKAVLPPDDPLVETSGENLREFCEAQGSPVYLAPTPSTTPPSTLTPPIPPPAPTLPPTPARPLTMAAQQQAVVRDESQATPESKTATDRSRQVAAGVIIAAGLALVVFMTVGGWPGSDEPLEPQGESTTGQEQPAPAQATRTPDTEPVAPAPPVKKEATAKPAAPNPAATTPAATKPAAVKSATENSEGPARPVSVSGPVSVVTAQLCRALSSDWQCTPATNPANPGRMFFYTRLRSSIAANVEHRWYYEGRLLQTVRLRISASQGPGYRTYSRTTVTAERPGAWSVELRSRDGTVLHEERFQVLN